MSTEMLWYTMNIVRPIIIKLMLFKRIILFAKRLRLINGDFPFADVFLSTIINKVREMIDPIEKMMIGINAVTVDE
jgi:hypothetical protein